MSREECGRDRGMREVCWGPGMVLGGTSPLSRLPAQVVCSVGRGDRPLRHQSSLPRTLEAALAQCGLAEASQVAIVRQRVKAAAEAALAAVLTLEAGLSAEQRGGRQVRTDFLGECGTSGDEDGRRSGGIPRTPEGGLH